MKVVPVQQAEHDAYRVQFRHAGGMWELLRECCNRSLSVEICDFGNKLALLISSPDHEVAERGFEGQWVVFGPGTVEVFDDATFQPQFRAVPGKPFAPAPER